jgi:hypothetical protein
VWEQYLIGCDRRRADTVAEQLSAVPTPASTTAASLARRFTAEQWLSVEDGLAEIAQHPPDLEEGVNFRPR